MKRRLCRLFRPSRLPSHWALVQTSTLRSFRILPFHGDGDGTAIRSPLPVNVFAVYGEWVDTRSNMNLRAIGSEHDERTRRMAILAAFKGMKGLGLSTGLAFGLIAAVFVANKWLSDDKTA